MKIRCIANTGKFLRQYEDKRLRDDQFGKFGTSAHYKFEIDIGREYLVMGMIMGEGILDYIIDDSGYVYAFSVFLFEVIERTIPDTWFFRSLKLNDSHFPYKEAIWGYKELVFDEDHYDKLVEMDYETMKIYYRNKILLERWDRELQEQNNM